MTVTSQTARDEQACNGVTIDFTVPFRILVKSDLLVQLRDTTVTPEVVSTLVLDSDYTITSFGGENTTVRVTPAEASGKYLSFSRDVPLTQETDYVENDAFPAESHENALDKQTMILQQLRDLIARALGAASDDPSSGFNYDAQGRRIRRVATALDLNDAVPYTQVLSMIGGTAPLVAGYVMSGANTSSALPGTGLAVWSAALTAGKKYRVKILGSAQKTAAGSYGFHVRQYSAGGLAGSTLGRAMYRDQSDTAMKVWRLMSSNGSNGSAEAGFDYTPAVNNDSVVFDVEFVFACTTSGTMEFRFGNTTGNGAHTVQLDAGTAFTIEELPFA